MASLRGQVIALTLLAAALIVRAFFAARLAFPPLDDPTFYLQTTRNLAAGRGLVSDVIWNYFVAFSSVTHPGHEYWIPLAMGLMATFNRVFGDILLSAPLPGIISPTQLDQLSASAQRVWLVYRSVLERNHRLTRSLPFDVFTQIDMATQHWLAAHCREPLAEYRLTAITVLLCRGNR